jgi:hypothetical protein
MHWSAAGDLAVARACYGGMWAEIEAKSYREELAIAYAIELLKRLDELTGSLLQLDGRLCHPANPGADEYAIVLKPAQPYYAGDVSPVTREPATLRADLWMLLKRTYVVRPDGQMPLKWTIRRLPPEVDALFDDDKAQHRVLLVSFPHDARDLRLEVDLTEGKFQVRGFHDAAELEIREQLSPTLRPHLESARWSVILCSEYGGTPAVRQRFQELLRSNPEHAAIVFPGTALEHDAHGRRENCCRAIVPASVEADHLPRHAKLSRFAITPSHAPRDIQEQLRARVPPVLVEDIDVEHAALTIWHSSAIGRFAVLTCRDVLEEALRPLLRSHYLDHLFVPAMSPALDDFLQAGIDLAAAMGAGMYVANAALATTPGQKRPVALGYRPFRGAHVPAQAMAWCERDDDHRVCARGFDFARGWRQ